MIKILTSQSDFVNSFAGELESLLDQTLNSKKGEIENLTKESVEDMEAVDTSLLVSNTSVKHTRKKLSRIMTFATNDRVNYAIFVLLGLGTNRKYGARNYLLASANKTKLLLETGSYARVKMSGASVKTGRLGKKGKRNLKAYNKKKSKK